MKTPMKMPRPAYKTTAGPEPGRAAAAHATKHAAQRAVAAGNMSLEQFHQVIQTANTAIASEPTPMDNCGSMGPK